MFGSVTSGVAPGWLVTTDHVSRSHVSERFRLITPHGNSSLPTERRQHSQHTHKRVKQRGEVFTDRQSKTFNRPRVRFDGEQLHPTETEMCPLLVSVIVPKFSLTAN